MKLSNGTVGALDVFSRVRDALKEAKSSSIIEYTRPARVEPIVLLDDSIRHQPYVPDILKSLVSIFGGYYLQAISLSCNIGNVDTLRLLDKMNPNRDLGDSAMNGASRAVQYLGVESYEEGLPMVGLESKGRNKVNGLHNIGKLISTNRREAGAEHKRRKSAFHTEQRRRQHRKSVADQKRNDSLNNSATRRGNVTSVTRREMENYYSNLNRRRDAKVNARTRETADRIEQFLTNNHDAQVQALRRDEYRKTMGLSPEQMEAADKVAGAYDAAIATGMSEAEARTLSKSVANNFKDVLNPKLASAVTEVAEETCVDDKKFKYSPDASIRFGRDTVSNLNTDINLSVGKMLEVDIESNGSSATIPVNVRLNVKSVSGAKLPALLTNATQDTSMKARHHKWRSGELHFIKDILLCQDIIDNHKKALMVDKDGSLRAIVNRGTRNRFSALLSGDISVANASSMIVISHVTAKQIERELTGRLSDFRTREKLFKSTHTMIMVVVDTEWEQAVIYHRSIRDESEISVKEFSTSGKEGGPNINEILSAYKLGSAPNI